MRGTHLGRRSRRENQRMSMRSRRERENQDGNQRMSMRNLGL